MPTGRPSSTRPNRLPSSRGSGASSGRRLNGTSACTSSGSAPASRRCPAIAAVTALTRTSLTVASSARAARLTRQSSTGSDQATWWAARCSPLIADFGSKLGQRRSLPIVCASSTAVASAWRGCRTTSIASCASEPARATERAQRRAAVATSANMPLVRRRPAVGQRQHHAREGDAVGDAVVHAREHRRAVAVAVDQVDLPQRARAVERHGRPVARRSASSAARSPGAGSATWWTCRSRSSSTSSQCGPVTPSTGRWREAVEPLDEALVDDRPVGAPSRRARRTRARC